MSTAVSLTFSLLISSSEAPIVASALRRLYFLPSIHFNMYEDDSFLLEAACKMGDFPLVKFIVETFYSETAFFKAFITAAAFRLACQNNHLEIAQWLLSVKPSINVHAHQEYAFRSICRQGHLNVAKWLLSVRPNINVVAANHGAFRLACKNGHLQTAKWLFSLYDNEIAHQKNMLIAVRHGAFMDACKGGHLHVAKWLYRQLKHRRMLNHISIQTWNDMFDFACKNGHLFMAQWLWKINAAINPQSNRHCAFICACEEGHMRTAKWVISVSNKQTLSSEHVNDAFILACRNGHLKMVKWIYNMWPTRINANSNLGEGETCLYFACLGGYTDIIEWLVKQKRLNINVAKNHGLYFTMACEGGHLEVAKLLLRIAPDEIDITNRQDLSFRMACFKGHWEIAKWLESLRPDIYKVLPITAASMRVRRGRGIPFKILQRLPISGTTHSSILVSEPCPICSEAVCQVMTECMHSFCEECMTNWWNASSQSNSRACPYCREPIETFKRIQNQINTLN